MSDPHPSEPPAAPLPTSSLPRRRSLGARLLRWVAVLVIVMILGAALYTWASLKYVYSEGERAGYVQKFSKKGWVCKTWEGELAMVNLPGQPAEIFTFTVPDEAVAAQITTGMGQRMALSYEYHPGIPTSCFGDTQFFVVRVRLVADE